MVQIPFYHMYLWHTEGLVNNLYLYMISNVHLYIITFYSQGYPVQTHRHRSLWTILSIARFVTLESEMELIAPLWRLPGAVNG